MSDNTERGRGQRGVEETKRQTRNNLDENGVGSKKQKKQNQERDDGEMGRTSAASVMKRRKSGELTLSGSNESHLNFCSLAPPPLMFLSFKCYVIKRKKKGKKENSSDCEW